MTVKDINGKTNTYSVVGVDELDLEADAISWISPFGRTLLAAELGDRIILQDGRTAKIMKIDHRAD